MCSRIITVFVTLLVISAPASAYVGPGLGAGAIGVIVGLIGSIFLALFSVFYYPLKRKYKQLRGEEDTDEEVTNETEEESATR